MPLRPLDSRLLDRQPAALPREEWELLFAAIQARLERTVVIMPVAAEPDEAMSRVRIGVLECVEALRRLQLLLPQASSLAAAAVPDGVDGQDVAGFVLAELSATLRPNRPEAMRPE